MRVKALLKFHVLMSVGETVKSHSEPALVVQPLDVGAMRSQRTGEHNACRYPRIWLDRGRRYLRWHACLVGLRGTVCPAAKFAHDDSSTSRFRNAAEIPTSVVGRVGGELAGRLDDARARSLCLSLVRSTYWCLLPGAARSNGLLRRGLNRQPTKPMHQ